MNFTLKDERDCFAEDVLIDLGYTHWTDDKSLAWALRWMERNQYTVNEVSTGTVADECRTDFERYILKKKYTAPAITTELDLEVKAGSPGTPHDDGLLGWEL